jgi:hypothetical protein
MVVEFPANPRNTFPLLAEPKAKAVPPKLKVVAALTAPFTSSLAVGEVVLIPTFPAVLWKMCEFPNLVGLVHSGR